MLKPGTKRCALIRNWWTLTSLKDTIGGSPLMLEVYAKIRRIAPHFSTVLITGATGTGKEWTRAPSVKPVGFRAILLLQLFLMVDSLVEKPSFLGLRGGEHLPAPRKTKLDCSNTRMGGLSFSMKSVQLVLAAQAKLLCVPAKPIKSSV